MEEILDPLALFMGPADGRGAILISTGTRPNYATAYPNTDAGREQMAHAAAEASTTNVFLSSVVWDQSVLDAGDGLTLSNATPAQWFPCLWADIDRPQDLDKDRRRVLEQRAHIRVRSGTPGRYHLRLPLADPIRDRAEFARLNLWLADALGGVDRDKSHPAMWLTTPGTKRFKDDYPRGRSISVVSQDAADPWTVDELTALFASWGVPEPRLAVTVDPDDIDAEPIAEDALPGAVRAFIRGHDGWNSGARHTDHYKFVGEMYKAHTRGRMTEGQALFASLNYFGPVMEKVADERGGDAAWIAQDFARCWAKHERDKRRDTTTLIEYADDSPIMEDDDDPLNLRGQFVGGGAFVHGAQGKVPALWGHDGDQVLWSPNEGLMITSPTGVGKTTLAGLLVEARTGFSDNVIGLPVKAGNRRTLYLAMDRPAQIARALHRQMSRHPQADVDERMAVWQGPPPGVFADDHQLLLKMARAADADTVVVDSLKDAVIALRDDVVAGAWNRNVQECNTAGVEVLILHHQRKTAGGADSPKPKAISDVYGSHFYTAGLGSVLLLWRAGTKLEVTQLKGPSGLCDAIELVTDNIAGTLVAPPSRDAKLRYFSQPHTVKEYARWLVGRDEVTPREVESARREVLSMLDNEDLFKSAPPTGVKPRGARPDYYERMGG